MNADFSTEAIEARRECYHAGTQRKVVPQLTPMIFQRGQGQYLWDQAGQKYIDLLAMDVRVSVGHAPDAGLAAARA